MALHHMAPGSLEGVEPQVALQPVGILIEVRIGRCVGKTVKQESLLQRGQIVHGFNLLFIAHDSVP